MKKFTCFLCDKEVEYPHDLPYGWAKVHEDAKGVHDSASVIFDYDYTLCPDCRPVIIKQRKIESEIE